MKDYFIRLIKYDQYANQVILKAIRAANDPEKPVQLMAHILAAQQRWLNRCTFAPVTEDVLWSEKEIAPLEELINDGHHEWINFLSALTPEDFTRKIRYKNTQGTEFNDSLTDILAHLINHGTHHRAQIGQQLKFAGFEELPNTDYINFVRYLM